MKMLMFYRQKRRDGSVRTGVELEDERMLECFEPGSPDEDPRLIWYIDVRCSQKKWPCDPEELRAWLLQNAPRIQNGLRKLAAELNNGIDKDWPLKHVVAGRDGVKIEIFCSAMRRVPGRLIQTEISKLAEDWQNIIAELPSREMAEAD